MLTKSILLSFSIALLISSSPALSTTIQPFKKDDCAFVDGPANLRKIQNGPLIMSIENNSSVLVEKQQGDWVQVSGSFEDGKKLHCYSSDRLDENNQRIGWIHVKNLKHPSWEERLRLDPVAALINEKSEFRPHYRVTLKSTCKCGRETYPYHDIGSTVAQDFKSGAILGNDCEISNRVARCTLREVANSTIDYCPMNCVTATKSKFFFFFDRNLIFSTRAKEEKEKLKKELSPKMNLALDKKYINWLPLLLRNPKRDSDYELELIMTNSLKKYKTSLIDKKYSEVFVFFETLDAAKTARPTIALRNNLEIEFFPFPFDLKNTELDEYSPRLCLSKRPEWQGVFACRSQDEISPPIGGFNIRTKASKTESDEDVLVNFRPKPAESDLNQDIDYCCDSKYFENFD